MTLTIHFDRALGYSVSVVSYGERGMTTGSTPRHASLMEACEYLSRVLDLNESQ